MRAGGRGRTGGRGEARTVRALIIFQIAIPAVS